MSTIEFNNRLISLITRLEYYAMQLTANADDAKDLIQETVYKALKNRDKFDSTGNFKAWIYTIMKNTFINNYRRSQRFGQYFKNVGNDDYLELDVKTTAPTPHDDYKYNELESLVNNLDDNYRVPFTLYNKGFKYEEISDKLELPIGTVKSRIFLARKKLMDKVNKA